MENIITYIFGFLGVAAIIVIRYLDIRCADCERTNAIERIIGGYILLVLAGPKTFRSVFTSVVERLSDFSIGFKKKDD